jgi:tetratricopeptide (TPR) repeat protein
MPKPRRSSDPKPEADGPRPAPISPRSTEQVMARLGEILGQHEFASVAELNEFVAGMDLNVLDEEMESPGERTPLARAQDLVYEAWEAPTRREAVRLAEEALRVCADCADAYNLLVEVKATSPAEARAYYEAGMRAGERALGPEPFRDDVGHFWGLLSTRPYMRARQGLALTLWKMGERLDAIGHLRELLRLNPNDNQGNRHVLLDWLLAVRDLEGAETLLAQYDDDGSAEWAYGRALLLFMRGGDTPDAREAVADALSLNPHVPRYLLGERKLPRELPEYIGLGDEREAQAYAAGAMALWLEVDGARPWLARRRAAARKRDK